MEMRRRINIFFSFKKLRKTVSPPADYCLFDFETVGFLIWRPEDKSYISLQASRECQTISSSERNE